MIPIKWKVYKILNYVLLVIASILFLIVCVLTFGGNVVEKDPSPYLIALAFLMMIGQCIINLNIFSKNFPDKILSGLSATAHTVATVINFIALLGLTLVTIAGFVIEFGNKRNSSDWAGRLMLVVCIFLWLTVFFILLCQLTLNRYLRQKNMDLFTTMIDSIGNKTDQSD